MKTILVSLAAAVMALGACSAEDTPGLPTRTVALTSPDGTQTVTILAEHATTDSARAQGLMFRQHLADGRGMLFTWPTADIRRMWMKNTYISLDMVFANNTDIVGLIHSARPLSLQHLGPNASADSVLEVPAGTLKRHGITEAWTFHMRQQ